MLVYQGIKETFIEEIEVEKDELEETYKQMSPFKLILRRFFRSRLSVVGLVILVFLFLFSFLGPVIYNKWGETEVDRTQVINYINVEHEYIDEYGEKQVVIQQLEIVSDNLKAKPSLNHILGTDEKGMDIFTRLMYGGRISLTIGFIVVILETLLGVLLGGIAGYFGGKVDQLIMRIVDVFNCIPMLPILLIASAVLDSLKEFIDPSNRIYFLMLIITIFGWSGCARMVRGQILSLREQEYIVATEVMGLPTWRKIFKHLIPNVMPQLIVNMTLGLGSIILYESTLSYLGLGVQIPYAAWGTMISSSKDPVILSYYMNMWLPAGILIVLAVLGFNFVGDGLRDAMDPKSKK
jgi:peptide/nickel transport system permease protein